MDLSHRNTQSVSPRRLGLWRALLYLAASVVVPPQVFAGAVDQLSDLTNKAAHAVVTLRGRDNFNSEYFYDVSVKNVSPDALVGESLVIVLDKITNIGGSEWMAGTSESNLARMEILGQDGETNDGKPYFQIPRGSALDLPPYTQSSPITVRIRNKDYLIVFTPVFRVYGMKRLLGPSNVKKQIAPSRSPTTPTDKLIQLLIQKGMLSQEEGRALYP